MLVSVFLCKGTCVCKCIFVLKPSKIIKKYETDMEYTDWTKENRMNQEWNDRLNTNKDG